MSTLADGPPEVTAAAVAAPVGRRRVLLTLATVLATAALAAYCLLLVVPSLLGFQRYVLTGGSMEPTLHRGSLVFDRVTDVQDLGVGDVITYVPPGMSRPLSHRIVKIARDDDGVRVFRTRGDANDSVDPWRFTLDEPQQARVVFDVPLAGYPLWVLGSPLSRLLLIGFPALTIGLVTIRRLWRQAGDLVAAEQAAAVDDLVVEEIAAAAVPEPADQRVTVAS
jgi:signal peptidase